MFLVAGSELKVNQERSTRPRTNGHNIPKQTVSPNLAETGAVSA